METVEAKQEVNVVTSVDITFSQETGDRFVSQALLFKRCWAFLRSFDIRYSDKERKAQREISDIRRALGYLCTIYCLHSND